ncbi:kinesin-like protein KIF25 isoform X2 [Oscarella lobularis]
MEALFGYKRMLRIKDERIAALETENAMLYLKLAQSRSEIERIRKAKNVVVRLYEKLRQSVLLIAQNIDLEVKILKEECADLRAVVFSFLQGTPAAGAAAASKAHLQITRFINHSIDLNATAADTKSQLITCQMELDSVRERYAVEKSRRKNLHNELVEIRGNIRVHCRVRPILDLDNSDKSGWDEPIIMAIDEEIVSVQPPAVRRTFQAELPPAKTYEYDRVYGPDDGQANVFQDVKPLIVSLLDGYNVCIMAYGQTGSGKTHTMLGNPESDQPYYGEDSSPVTEAREGIVPQSAREIFRLLEAKGDELASYSVDVSLLEIYNNEIRDLISGQNKLDANTGPEGTIEVPSLQTRSVSSVTELMKLVRRGTSRRAEDATLIHDHSSRSHFVVTLTVTLIYKFSDVLLSESQPLISFMRRQPREATVLTPPLSRTSPLDSPSVLSCASSMTDFGVVYSPSLIAESKVRVKTKLQLVDLAGSECVGMSGVRGSALRESSYINRSLSALADVLGALAESSSHIPYRNSKLTYLLQDSIGGDAKLLIVTCVSPTQKYLAESQQTLGFGCRARMVQRGPVKKRRQSQGATSSRSPKSRSRSSPLLAKAKPRFY